MSGVKEYDDRAVKMPLAGAQQLLQTKKVERLLVMLNDTDDTAAVRATSRALRQQTLGAGDQGLVAAGDASTTRS